MNRSEIDRLIDDAIAFMNKNHFCLPPFGYWTKEAWLNADKTYQEIKDVGLGWDLTDFGSGDFMKMGLLLFTLRNGSLDPAVSYPKPYAEKIMIVRERQVTPYHFHWHKMEDIINRGGGNLIIRLYNANAEEQLDLHSKVTVHKDGKTFSAAAGSEVCLCPGESITLLPYQYHSFWGEDGTGKVLVGEVSMTNDDHTDNRFLDQQGRFPQIEEDVPARYMLCTEYPV